MQTVGRTYTLSEQIATAAATGGHLNAFKWAMQNGCCWSFATANMIFSLDSANLKRSMLDILWKHHDQRVDTMFLSVRERLMEILELMRGPTDPDMPPLTSVLDLWGLNFEAEEMPDSPATVAVAIINLLLLPPPTNQIDHLFSLEMSGEDHTWLNFLEIDTVLHYRLRTDHLMERVIQWAIEPDRATLRDALRSVGEVLTPSGGVEFFPSRPLRNLLLRPAVLDYP